MKTAISRFWNLILSREPNTQVPDRYVLDTPSDQTILDIFKGEWSSKIPEDFGMTTAPAAAGLFEDARVEWTESVFGSFEGWRILELGPLEAAHSYMFQQRKAESIVAVEANTRAFLKCLCIKEVLKLDKLELKLGDFMQFMNQESSRYDMIFASGVLYHMEEPIELLARISQLTDRVFIWTQYYDEEIIAGRPGHKKQFSPIAQYEYNGDSYDYSTQSYGSAVGWAGFCGGPKPVSKWLTRQSLMKALERFGFSNVEIEFDHPQHPNGPALAICASR